jgi:hypothetical protein
MTCHFTCALNITALNKTKQQLHRQSVDDAEDEEEQDEYDEDLDVDVSMDVEVTENDVEEISPPSGA